MSYSSDLQPMPPASGRIIDIVPRQEGSGGGLGSGLGEGVGGGEAGGAFGVPERSPFDGELEFFRQNPTVAGMATEDGAVTINPTANLSPQQREAVVRNEAARVLMRGGAVPRPDFELTDAQRQAFQGYGTDQDIRETIAARLMTNDPSAGDGTPEQQAFSARLQAALAQRAPAASIAVEVVGQRPAPPSMLGMADAAPMILPAEVEGRFSSRFWGRMGVLPPAPEQPAAELRAQPDPAGFDAIRSPTEPRRGTLRLSPGGTPQLPEGMPLPPRPPEPEAFGPQQPAEPIGANLLREDVTNLMLAMRQGVTASALNMAEPVDDFEIRRRLEPGFNDDGPVAERLAAARERAAELGLEVVFRAGRDGRIEAVARTPDMAAPGGAAGRVADALGRLFGLGFVDPVGGAVALGARGAAPAAGVASAGGAGPYGRVTRQARRAVDARINRTLPGGEQAIMALAPEGQQALRQAIQGAYREELLRAINALPEAERTQALLQHMRQTVPSTVSTVAHLLPDEQRLITARNVTNMARQIAQVQSALPPVEQVVAAALAGQAKRGWYERSARAIVEVFGADDARRFAALLAATSPQTSVESNLTNAIRIWIGWDRAGRPSDPAEIQRIMGASVQGGRGEDSILPAWINNSITALTERDPLAITLSGPKVNSFMLNLVDAVDEVTNDAWVANFMGIPQDLFSKAGNDPGKGAGYLVTSALQREAAQILTERTGELWTPREVQETVWSFAKAAYEAVYSPGPGRQAAATTVEEAVRQGRITDAMIASTPDFELLFAQGAYRDILEAGGYGERVRDVARAVESRRGADAAPAAEGGRSAGEGAGDGAHAFRDALLDAARRLDRLAGQRRRTTNLAELRDVLARGLPGGQPAGSFSRSDQGLSEGDLAFARLGALQPGDVSAVHRAEAEFTEALGRLVPSAVIPTEIRELAQGNERAASLFAAAISSAKRSSKYGAAVHVYEPQEYAQMRLFLAPDGRAGFALNGDDIVSVFNHNSSDYSNATLALLNLAVQQGGRRLDAFDTVLPGAYSQVGFRVVSRTAFDPAQRPQGWSYARFQPWNNGRPDVVFMVWDPGELRLYSGRAEGRMADGYEQAARIQQQAADRIAGRAAAGGSEE